MIVLYGIKNCDTCKKARAWLDQHEISYRFHDFRDDGLTESQLQSFIDKLGWEVLLNKTSTSWRQLSAEQQAGLTEAKAKQLMFGTPTLIKRPVLVNGDEIIVGFKHHVYESKLT